jgi:hypothetical protein
MKRYIKPNTEMHSVELQSMIANTTVTLNKSVSINNDTEKWTDLGKESETISSTSVWGEEE